MSAQTDIGQSGFSLLIEYTRAEIGRVQEVIKQATHMEEALIKSLETLSKVDSSAFGNSNSTQIEHVGMQLQSLREPGYPYKAKKDEKILFLMRKFNRGVRVQELADEFIRIEGAIDGRVVAKSLHYKLNQMVADNQMVVAKWLRSKTMFYFLPEHFENLEKGNVIIKSEHLPPDGSWGNTPIEDRNFHKAKWIFFIKPNN